MQEANRRTPVEWKNIGFGLRVSEGVSFSRTVDAMPCKGGYMVRVYEHASVQTFILAAGPDPGHMMMAFVPADSLEDLRSVFFEEEEEDGGHH